MKKEKVNLNVLLVEDSQTDAEFIKKTLSESTLILTDVEHVETLQTAIEAIGTNKIDIILLNLGLPDSNGMNTLAEIEKVAEKVPIIVITGWKERQSGVDALKKGAQDYLIKKNINSILLSQSILFAVERKQFQVRISYINSLLLSIRNINQIIVREKNKRKLINKVCEELVKTRKYYNVWIVLFDEKKQMTLSAETGVGKEFIPLREWFKRGKMNYCSKQALKQKKPVFIKKSSLECGDCPLKEINRSHIDITIQLENAGIVFGILSLSFSKEQKIDEKELSLIKEVADDVAFALHNIDMEEEKEAMSSELVHREEHLRTILNSVGDAVITTDTKGYIDGMNPVAEQLIGLKENKAKGKPFSVICRLFNVKDRHPIKDIVKRVLELSNKIELPEHTILITSSGKEYYVSDSTSPIRDANGKITGVVIIFKDITEEYKIRENLHENQKLLSLILKTTHEGILLVNKDGYCSYINKKAVEIWHIPEKLIEGNNKKELLKIILEQLAEPDKFLENLGEMKHSKNIWDIIEFKDGRIFERFSSRMFVKKKGFQLLMCFRDITKQKKAENNLKKFQFMVESANDAIFFKDLQSRYIIVNNSTAKAFGLSKAEVIGKTDSELLSNEIEAKALLDDDRQVFKTEKSLGSVKQITNVNGSIIWFQDMKTPQYDDKYNLIGLVGVARDITQTKKYEEEMLKTNKMEALAIFAGGLAHDFNNILMGIFGNISIALLKLSEEHPAYKNLKNAENSFNRATRLTNQLLTFSSGGKPIVSEVKIEELIKKIVRLDLSGSNVKDVFKIVGDLWEVKGDKSQLEQVISNLIINARQAMPEGGYVNIKMENVKISKNEYLNLKEGDYIKCTISDVGIGIAPRHLKKIFDPFFTTKNTGNGLGLATTYSIIKKHKGHISVESILDKGTTFTILLPAISDKSKKPVKKKEKFISEEDVIQNRKFRILVMDDEKGILDVISSMLSAFGYTVKVSTNAKQTIEIYKKAMKSGERFDLVILDLTIPGGWGGKKVIKELLKIDPTVKAVVSSGYTDDPSMSNYTEYGFLGYLAKPFSIESLKHVVKNVLET